MNEKATELLRVLAHEDQDAIDRLARKWHVELVYNAVVISGVDLLAYDRIATIQRLAQHVMDEED